MSSAACSPTTDEQRQWNLSCEQRTLLSTVLEHGALVCDVYGVEYRALQNLAARGLVTFHCGPTGWNTWKLAPAGYGLLHQVLPEHLGASTAVYTRACNWRADSAVAATAATALPSFSLVPGDVVRTSYGTGDYRVESVKGPCSCQPPNSSWNRYCVWPVQPHYHMEVTDLRPLSNNLAGGKLKKGGCYLGFYVEHSDGRFLSSLGQYDYLKDEPTGWPPDELFVVERAKIKPGTQFSLF